MPTTGYDDDAMRIGARSFKRGWRFKVMLLAVIGMGAALGAALATWLR